MPNPKATVTMRRSTRRILQPQNRRMLSSSPESVPLKTESPPMKKKRQVKGIKTEEEKEDYQEVLLSSPESVLLKTERSPIQKKRLLKEVKKEKEEDNDENTSIPSSDLSEYERKVQEKVAEHRRLLESLGILKVKEELTSSLAEERRKKVVYRGIVQRKKSPEPVVRRRSLRQQRLTPDGSNLPLPTDEEVARAERSATTTPADEHPRPPPGPAPLMDYYSAPNREECEAMLRDLVTVSSSVSSTSVSEVWSGSQEKVVGQLKRLQLTEEHVVKVVPDRIFSAIFHPTVEKTLLLVGGKWGGLGVWEVGRQDESYGAYTFQPHSRPLNCMSISPEQHCLVHTTSYDCSLRQTDLHTGLVTQVYALDDDLRRSFLCWHTQLDNHTFLLAASLGRVIKVDARVAGGAVQQFLVHQGKTVKVVTAHPHHPHYYTTGGSDGLACLWDIRNHKKNKPLDIVPHGRHITGLEFSASGDTLISTSNDNNLRFITCNRMALKVERKISHNNCTGRWLTTFKARFVPQRDDLVCVGSMLQPRRIEVWGRDGQLKYNLAADALGSVSSIVAMHPHQPALAGCNSSGKVHLFM